MEIARELYHKLQDAEEKYIMIQNEREKITEIEVIKIDVGKPSLSRFRLVTEKGTILLLTPSQFLKKKYVVVKDGKEYHMIGS
jgi:hypothetical protein